MEPIDIGRALKIGRATHAGMSGKHNEDYYGFFAWRMQDGRPFYLGVVADGVGGQNAGEVASRLAVQRVGEYFTALPQVNNVLAHLERAILSAHDAVYQYSQEHPETQGMATTMVVAAILDNRLYTSSVGDSRVYFWREGRLRQISVDHTWAQEAIEAGLLTQEQAKTHPNRNVIKRFLGSSGEVKVDQRLMWEEGQEERVARGNQGLVLEPGDTILLNSDGLTDMIEDSAVLQSLHKHYYNLPKAADELIEKANEGGGKDNITVLIMQVPGGRLPAGVAVPERAAPAAPPAPTVMRAPAAAAAVPAVGERQRRSGLAITLILGEIGLLGIILALGVGGLLLAGDNGDDEPSATPTVAVVEPAASETAESTATEAADDTIEAPATAILIVVTAEGTVQPASTTTGTTATSPVLIPTLQPTWTPTRIPPTRTPLPPPTQTAAPTATPTPEDGGDGGSSQPPPPPPATEPPPPTATEEPPPTPE